MRKNNYLSKYRTGSNSILNNKNKNPLISDSDFYDKIKNKFAVFVEKPTKKKTYTDLCFPKQFELRNSQKFPAAYISPDTKYTDLLLFHQIGSGKTCSMIQIGEKWKKERKIIFVCPAGLIGNFVKELKSSCANEDYLTNNEKDIISKLNETDTKYIEIMEKSDKRIKKYYEIYSQHKFINLLKKKQIDFVNKVLLIDEIQNMVSINGSFYKILKSAINKAPNDLRVVLASATPMFDKPYEIGLTMNLLRIPKKFPEPQLFANTFIKTTMDKNGTAVYTMKNKDTFNKLIRGYISYFSGGNPITMPTKKINIVNCEMSTYQYKTYKTILKDSSFFKRVSNSGLKVQDIFNKGEILDLPNNFFIGPRIISNIAYPDNKIGDEGIKLFDGSPELINKCSPKIKSLLKKITKSTGKSYIYSNFRKYGGIMPISISLEYIGYKNYENHGPGNKRYAIWSGQESQNYRNKVIRTYNNENNNYGEHLEIILLSSAGKEGLSLYGVRNAHIFEPYWNISRLDQIIGRGVRFCSHKNMPVNERNVDINIYIATYSKMMSIDEYIYSIAKKKDGLIKQFEKELIKSSVDNSFYQ